MGCMMTSYEKAQNENELIILARQGNNDAMTNLLSRHRSFVFHIAQRFFCSDSQRDELIQAGYIGLIRAVRHYDICSGVKLLTYALPWILGEMKRAVHNWGGRAISLDSKHTETPLHEQIAGESGIHLGYIDLRIALQKLPEEERFLLCLRYYRDLSQAETAQLLRKSQAQISRIERRALDHLHELLA